MRHVAAALRRLAHEILAQKTYSPKGPDDGPPGYTMGGYHCSRGGGPSGGGILRRYLLPTDAEPDAFDRAEEILSAIPDADLSALERQLEEAGLPRQRPDDNFIPWVREVESFLGRRGIEWVFFTSDAPASESYGDDCYEVWLPKGSSPSPDWEETTHTDSWYYVYNPQRNPPIFVSLEDRENAGKPKGRKEPPITFEHVVLHSREKPLVVAEITILDPTDARRNGLTMYPKKNWEYRIVEGKDLWESKYDDRYNRNLIRRAAEDRLGRTATLRTGRP